MTTPRTARRRTSPALRKQWTAAYLLILPFIALFVALVLVPLGYSAYLSLFVERLIGGVSFVGFENYLRAFTDGDFLSGIGRTALFFLVQVPVMLLLSLLFALALDSGKVRGTPALRLLIFVPYAVPGVIATLMWGYLYGQNFGPMAQIAEALGLDKPDFLASGTVIFSIANIVTWGFVGYNMIVMYAALRNVPPELYEAAEIDGATAWQVAWNIKIPAIRPAILLTLIFSIIGSFQLFNEPNLLRGLAPDAIGPAFTPNMYAYNLAFVRQEFNYAAAVAVVLGIVIMTISYFVQLSLQRKERAR